MTKNIKLKTINNVQKAFRAVQLLSAIYNKPLTKRETELLALVVAQYDYLLGNNVSPTQAEEILFLKTTKDHFITKLGINSANISNIYTSLRKKGYIKGRELASFIKLPLSEDLNFNVTINDAPKSTGSTSS